MQMHRNFCLLVQSKLIKINNPYLNIGVLCDELDTSFKASKTIRSTAKKTFHNRVVFVCFLNLLSVVLKDDSNKLDESNQEASESDRSKVISENPLYSCTQRPFS